MALMRSKPELAAGPDRISPRRHGPASALHLNSLKQLSARGKEGVADASRRAHPPLVATSDDLPGIVHSDYCTLSRTAGKNRSNLPRVRPAQCCPQRRDRRYR
jgi:hypothetical protein